MDTTATNPVFKGPFPSERKEKNGQPYYFYSTMPYSALEAGVVSLFRDRGGPDEDEVGGILLRDPIVLIYDKTFLAECLKILLQAALDTPVEIYPSFESVSEKGPRIRSRLVMISIENLKKPETLERIRQAAAAVPTAPVVVLSHSLEPRVVREVMECGVAGCIPTTMGFAIAIEAVKFVLAGGTYVPPESLMETEPALRHAEHNGSAGRVTLREMAIIQAIQQGKSNKIIAYELKLCESTVKVHIRNIMKKLRAKNRTEVAVRSAEFDATF